MGGKPVVVAVFDLAFLMWVDRWALAVGEGLVTAAERAATGKTPLIVFPASGGARMQEAHAVLDANAAHDYRGQHGQIGGSPLYRCVHRSDNGRRDSFIRDGG